MPTLMEEIIPLVLVKHEFEISKKNKIKKCFLWKFHTVNITIRGRIIDLICQTIFKCFIFPAETKVEGSEFLVTYNEDFENTVEIS